MQLFLVSSFLIFIWSLSFVMIKVGLWSFSAYEVSIFRLSAATIFLLVYIWINKIAMPRGRDLFLIALSGLLSNAVYGVLINVASTDLAAGEVSFLCATTPLFVVSLGMLFRGEKVGWKSFTGMFIAFSGVVIMSLSGAEGLSLSVYALLPILAAILMATSTLIQKDMVERYSLYQVAAYGVFFGALPAILFLPFYSDELLAGSYQSISAVIYLGIFGNAVGFLVWMYLLKRLSRVATSSLLYLVPFGATGLASLLLDEVMPKESLMGGILIIAGVAIINFRMIRKGV